MFAIQPKYRCKTRAEEINEEDIQTNLELKQTICKLKIEIDQLVERNEWLQLQVKQDSADIEEHRCCNIQNRQTIQNLESDI